MATIRPIQVQKFLGAIDYPTDKQTLVDHARQEGAGQDIVDALRRMPERSFNSPNDVSEALGRIE
jgi:hypothetical protein